MGICLTVRIPIYVLINNMAVGLKAPNIKLISSHLPNNMNYGNYFNPTIASLWRAYITKNGRT